MPKNLLISSNKTTCFLFWIVFTIAKQKAAPAQYPKNSKTSSLLLCPHSDYIFRAFLPSFCLLWVLLLLNFLVCEQMLSIHVLYCVFYYFVIVIITISFKLCVVWWTHDTRIFPHTLLIFNDKEMLPVITFFSVVTYCLYLFNYWHLILLNHSIEIYLFISTATFAITFIEKCTISSASQKDSHFSRKYLQKRVLKLYIFLPSAYCFTCFLSARNCIISLPTRQKRIVQFQKQAAAFFFWG